MADFVVVCICWFILVVAARHAAIDHQHQRCARRCAYHSAGELRMADQWPSPVRTGEEFIDGWHPYARDLDVVGAKSLYARFDHGMTERGARRLADWLLGTAVPADQANVVHSLVASHAWRAELHSALHDERSDVDQAEELAVSWFTSQPQLPGWAQPAGMLLTAVAFALPLALWWFLGVGPALVGALLMATLYSPLQHIALAWTPAVDADWLRMWCMARRDGLRTVGALPEEYLGEAKERLTKWRQASAEAEQALAELTSIADALAMRANRIYDLVLWPPAHCGYHSGERRQAL